MSDQDELLFGTGREPVRDSDGDGVSDGQEAVDGTDPNDANSSVRHDLPSLDPSLDPRGDLRQVTLERETTIDVTKNLPEGKSLEQNLPKGMDGKDIPTGQNHYGNADADKLLAGHTNDENSPLNVERDPFHPANPTKPAQAPKSEVEGGGGGGNSESKVGGTHHSTPPPGVVTSGSSDPDGPNKSLYGQTVTPKDQLDGLVVIKNPFASDPPPKAEQEHHPGQGKAPTKEETAAWLEKNKGKDVDPDADSGGGVPTDEQVARAVAVHGGATDVVRGHEAPQIDADGPPKRYGDLVTDKNPDAVDDDVSTATPPGQQISHPVNPQDNLPGGGLAPSPGPGPGGDGGDGGGDSGRASGYNMATATSTTDALAESNGVTNIGDGSSGGGIHAVGDVVTAGDATDVAVGTPVGATPERPEGVDPFAAVSGQRDPSIRPIGTDSSTSTRDVTGMGPGAPTDGPGRPGPGSTIAAGDDDDLEELEVERYVAPDADQSDGPSDATPPDDGGPGRPVISPMGGADDVTGMGPGAPTDGPGRPGPGSTIAAGDDDDLEELEVERYVAPDADQIDHPEDFPPGARTVGIIIPDVGIIIPDVDRPSGDDIVPVPLDPVADAMPSHLDMDQHEVPQGGFDVLEVDHALAVPDEIDLDDGF